MKRFAILAVAFTLLVPGLALAAMPGIPDDGELAFTITRNDKPIGRHVYKFENENGLQLVRVQTRILFELMGIPLYRFEHDSTEIWRNGRLIGLSSKTNDDGKKLELEVRAEGRDLAVTLNGKPDKLRETNIPASLWNPATVKSSSLIDTVDGDRMEIGVNVSDHFRLSGELERELWYDGSNILKEVKFTARDGSEIRYVRD